MKNKKILLPEIKWIGLFSNFCGAMLFLFESDFLRKPMDDLLVLLTLGAWIYIFLFSALRLKVSYDGLDVCLWRFTIRKVPVEKISRIEVVDMTDYSTILFELGKCPKFRRYKLLDSLGVFYFVNHPFRLIGYIPPENKKEEVLTLLKTLFPTKVVAGE